ncbi:MAG: YitT family protein [Clostridiales bacterium]|nr:YitT family protein [Clostridiales bacterium]
MERNLIMKKVFMDILTVIGGNLIYAAGVVFFIMPSGLITGGTTGIALTVHQLTGLNVSYFILAFNLCMFLLGFFVLGKKFALTTLISTFCYPVALELLKTVAGEYPLTNDIFLNTLFGGICIGVSIAMVIRVGASTGGMDIPPLILQKQFRIPISVSLYVADCLILVFQAVFSEREKILYGIVLVLIYSIVIDKLLMLGASKMQIKIISHKAMEIKSAIILQIDRGVTLLHGSSGYLEEEMDVVLSVVSGRELVKVEKLVHEIDKEAFVMISRVNEVRGRGFSSGKKYL